MSTRINDLIVQRDNGLWRTVIETGSVQLILVGHDHKNDFCGSFAAYPTVTLCYGRKTGYGYYNPWFSHGGRVVQLNMYSNGLVESRSWIRDEYGKIEEQKPHYPRGLGQYQCAGIGNFRRGVDWTEVSHYIGISGAGIVTIGIVFLIVIWRCKGKQRTTEKDV